MRDLVSAAEPQSPPRIATAYPEHSAEALTGGGNLAVITLHDQSYVLRITKQGKLLLTK
ncbi:MAG: hemin uptake protein HemP [Paracoccaceae bacterium]